MSSSQISDGLDLKKRQLTALNQVNQELWKGLEPRILNMEFYHSQNKFWTYVCSGVDECQVWMHRQRIYTYVPTASAPDCKLESIAALTDLEQAQAIQTELEEQQVELGRLDSAEAEERAKIDAAVKQAVSENKEFRFQAMDGGEITDKQAEQLEELCNKSQIWRLPVVSVRKAPCLTNVLVDEYD